MPTNKSKIIYWIVGEGYGSGDLRGYILVQFLPMLITPIILLNFKRKSAKAYWYLLLFYVFAKLFEHFDGQIFVSLIFNLLFFNNIIA
jgi:hypothetical protein